MAPAVRDKVSKKPTNRVEKPAIWQDVMVEVKETFRRIDKVTHSGFTMWDERCMRSGPTLSRNRMARVKTQAPLRNFNLPPRTLREIQNNRSQPPIVSFNHLQNLLGMCRRINAQSLLRERRKNPHDPSLYPVFLRRPVARASTPLPARTPPTSSTPRRASSTGTDRRRRSSTPPSAPVSRPLTPPVSARKRPLTARPAVDDPPYAYAPRRFTLLLDISNRPAALGPPPPLATRPPSAASTPRPGSSRSQKGDPCSKAGDQEQPHKKPRPPIPSLKKIPVDRVTPKLTSDRTFDRSSMHSGSLSSFGPMAAAYFDRRPHSAGDKSPLSAGDVHSERPPSRRQPGASANRSKPAPESQTRGLALADVSVPEVPESTASSLPERASPTSSSSSGSNDGSSVRSTTTMADTARSEATAPNMKSKGNLWLQAGAEEPSPNSDERPPSRRGAKPSRKKKRAVVASETTTVSTTTTTEPSIQEASDDNTSGRASNARGQTQHAKRPDPVVGGAAPPHKTRAVAPPTFIIEIKTPRAKATSSLGTSVEAKAKSSPSGVKPQELTQPSEEPSPGRPKVTFAAPSGIEEKKKGKESLVDIVQSTLDQALDRLDPPRQSKHGEKKAEAASGEDLKAKEGSFHHSSMFLTGGHPHAQPSSAKQHSIAVDVASEEEDARTRDSTDEDSIKTIMGIHSCSEISSEMSPNEHEEEDDDNEHEDDTDQQHRARVRNIQAKRNPSRGGVENLRDALEHQLLPHTERQDDQVVVREGENPSSVFVKYSADAYVDFKNSMMNLIRNEHLQNGPEDQLNALFQYYIDLNPAVHHNVLRQVIADIKVELKQTRSALK